VTPFGDRIKVGECPSFLLLEVFGGAEWRETGEVTGRKHVSQSERCISLREEERDFELDRRGFEDIFSRGGNG